MSTRTGVVIERFSASGNAENDFFCTHTSVRKHGNRKRSRPGSGSFRLVQGDTCALVMEVFEAAVSAVLTESRTAVFRTRGGKTPRNKKFEKYFIRRLRVWEGEEFDFRTLNDFMWNPFSIYWAQRAIRSYDVTRSPFVVSVTISYTLSRLVSSKYRVVRIGMWDPASVYHTPIPTPDPVSPPPTVKNRHFRLYFMYSC